MLESATEWPHRPPTRTLIASLGPPCPQLLVWWWALLPCGDDVSQLRRVRRNLDGDSFEIEVLLLRVDGVRARRDVLQAEGAVGFGSDCT